MTIQGKAVVSVFSICILLIFYFSIWGIRTTRIESINELVSQNLKPGMSSGEVIRFLDPQHLEHSQLIKPEIMTLGLGHDYGNQHIIAAIKRGTAKALLWGEAIQLIFVFNEKHELVRTDVFPRHAALF